MQKSEVRRGSRWRAPRGFPALWIGALLALTPFAAEKGMPQLRSSGPAQTPYYMEAELNSPMIQLQPEVSYAFETTWYPVRAAKDLKWLSSAGVAVAPLTATLETATLEADGLRLSGVFCSGKLTAHIFDDRGVEREVPLGPVDPLHAVRLDKTIQASPEVARVVLHLSDEEGGDVGTLAESEITRLRKDS